MGKDRSALRTSFYTEISGPFVCITIGIVETAHPYDRIMTSTRNLLPSLSECPREPQLNVASGSFAQHSQEAPLGRPLHTSSTSRWAGTGATPLPCLSGCLSLSRFLSLVQACRRVAAPGALLRTVSAVLSLSPATGPAAAATKP